MTTKTSSHVLFKTVLGVAKAYNRKINTQKFFHALFSALSGMRMKEEQTHYAYEKLLGNLDFFDVQHMRVHLLYYLHQEPKGMVMKGLSFSTLLQKMVQHNITSNKEFLQRGSGFIESLTRFPEFHERLEKVIQAFIWGTEVKSESTLPSREKLLEALHKCEEKVRRLQS